MMEYWKVFLVLKKEQFNIDDSLF